MKEQDIIYLAGVFDGEGCITAGNYRKTNYVQTSISVNGSFYPMMRRFYDVFGFGSLTVTTNRDKYSHAGTRDLWRWLIGNKAQQSIFLQAILPHLMEKKEQAGTLLRFIGGEKFDVVRELHDLKRFNFSHNENEVIYARGEPFYKLDCERTRDIYVRVKNGESGVKLAGEFKVSVSTISKIKRGDSTHIQDLIEPPSLDI